jgi:predicted nucleic acid-binding Zn ribbon protein
LSPGKPKRARQERSQEAQPIGSVLDSLTGGRPLAAGLALGELGRRWGAVVGDRLAQECSPIGLERGLLLVGAGSAAWAAQVKFLASQVRDRANEVLGMERVREVRVVVRQPSPEA